MSLITQAQVENELLGVMPYIRGQLTAQQITALFADKIDAAEARFEQDLAMYLSPTVIKMWPEDGAEFDEEEPPLPYDMGQPMFNSFPSWRLRFRPLISVEQLRLAFGPEAGQDALVVPTDWWRPNHRLGTVSIFPIGASAVAMQASVVWYLPLLAGGYKGLIPQMVCIDYTAGLPETANTDRKWALLRERLKLQAKVYVLEATRGLIPMAAAAGGLSQNFVPVQTQIEEGQKAVDEFIIEYNQTNRPMRVAML